MKDNVTPGGEHKGPGAPSLCVSGQREAEAALLIPVNQTAPPTSHHPDLRSANQPQPGQAEQEGQKKRKHTQVVATATASRRPALVKGKANAID